MPERRRDDGQGTDDGTQRVELHIRHRRSADAEQQHGETKLYPSAKLLLKVRHLQHHRHRYDGELTHLIKPNRIKPEREVEQRDGRAIQHPKLHHFPSPHRLAFKVPHLGRHPKHHRGEYHVHRRQKRH